MKLLVLDGNSILPLSCMTGSLLSPGLSSATGYGHSRRRRSADVLAHGQDDLGPKRHRDRLKVGSSLLVRNSRALRRAFEKFTHSDFNLPILQSLGK